MSTLGERIRSVREEKKLQQKELAELIDVKSAGVISNWERDLNKPDAEKIIKLCEVLKVSVSYLLDYYGSSGFETTLSEQDYIKKYRQLDGYGKKVVDQVLNIEHERILEQSLSNQPQETEHATLIHENRLYMTEYDYAPSAGTGNYLDEWDIPKSTISVPDTPKTRKADFVLRVSGDSMEPDYYDGDRVLVKSQDSVNLNDIAIYIIDGESYIKQYKGSYLHSLNPVYNDIQMNEGQAIKCVGKVMGKL